MLEEIISGDLSGSKLPKEVTQRVEDVHNTTSSDEKSTLGWKQVAALCVLSAACAALLGFLAWNWFIASQDAPLQVAATSPAPLVVSAAEVNAIAARLGHSVYWREPDPNGQLEATVDGDVVYLRYLSNRQTVGTQDPVFTVGTYGRKDAFSVLQGMASLEGARSQLLKGGALVVAPPDNANSVYFAFDGHDLLMEVFDPKPGRALDMVLDGSIRPVSP